MVLIGEVPRIPKLPLTHFRPKSTGRGFDDLLVICPRRVKKVKFEVEQGLLMLFRTKTHRKNHLVTNNSLLLLFILVPNLLLLVKESLNLSQLS